MKELSKRQSVCLKFFDNYDVLHALVGGYGHIGKGLKGHPGGMHLSLSLRANSIVPDFNQCIGWKWLSLVLRKLRRMALRFASLS